MKTYESFKKEIEKQQRAFGRVDIKTARKMARRISALEDWSIKNMGCLPGYEYPSGTINFKKKALYEISAVTVKDGKNMIVMVEK